ncbi:MAG: endonuclease/exonuclease/phosphatase family protein [Elusimicrobia bacterium]|nr:endonuclease/exonuclease/phosphatase family protein [Elusimicrobiota bacterium]
MKAAAFVLSILTLNVAGPRRVHQSWQSRREALRAELKAESPDAAAFQEVWRGEAADALAAAAGHPYRAHEPALGLAVTSRKRIVDRSALDLGGGCGILRAGIDLDGTTADVYSARLEPRPGAARRLGRLLSAAEFVRAQSKARPFVLLGDLAVSSDDRDAALFLDLVGARDLCVSHGDEMCGRTHEDRRVDYALIPYSSRPPREIARTAFTGTLEDNDETRPLSTHFGLAARLDGAWLKLRLAPEPEGRVEALGAAAERLDAARAEAESRARFAGWIPWRGTILALRVRAEALGFTADGERARSALARAAKAAPPAYE